MRWARRTMPVRRHPHQQHPRLPSARALAKHCGEWVAIVNRRIVAYGVDFREVVAKAKDTAPGKEPSLLHVPSDEILLL
jgi:hypothetical protein